MYEYICNTVYEYICNTVYECTHNTVYECICNSVYTVQFVVVLHMHQEYCTLNVQVLIIDQEQ